MSERLEQNINQLEFKNKELEQFAYVASHDLQEPLRTVTSFVELLERRHGNSFDESEREYMGFIVSSAQRMKQQIKALLDYSRIGADNREIVDFNKVVKEVAQDMIATIQHAECVLDYDMLPSVHGNYGSMKMLVQNLISNAIKFRQPDKTPHIKIGATFMGNYWQLYVQDNGIGIKKEYQEKIFVIFQRLHNSDKYDGYGIGLAHCKKIMELHNGVIWVESDEEYGGSTFYFMMPAETKVPAVYVQQTA